MKARRKEGKFVGREEAPGEEGRGRKGSRESGGRVEEIGGKVVRASHDLVYLQASKYPLAKSKI